MTTHKAKGFAGPQPWAVLQNVVASANCGPSHPTEGPARALNTFGGLSTGMETCRPLQQPGNMGSSNAGRVSTGDGHRSVLLLDLPVGESAIRWKYSVMDGRVRKGKGKRCP